MRSITRLILAVLPLLIAGLACSRMIPGSINLFEGDNAAKTAAKIKEKIGVDNVKVIRAEVRRDMMTITIQAPNNPKNIDKYTFEKGVVSGPEPVQVMTIGNLEMSGEKYDTTDLKEIGFDKIPETVRKAIELSKLENAEVDLISMDQQNVLTIYPNRREEKKQRIETGEKELKQKEEECFKSSSTDCMKDLLAEKAKLIEMKMGRGQTEWDLAWRLFIQSPRGREDFWADKQGNLNEKAY